MGTDTWRAPAAPAAAPAVAQAMDATRTWVEAPDVWRMPHLPGDVRVRRGFGSAYLDQARDVWLYLPPGYDADPAATYPVLYMHDGNNLFDPKEAYGGKAWGIHETAEWMIRAGLLAPMIVVGVANTPARLAEYSWVPDPAHGGGRGADYARFLTEELKPWVDGAFRTRTGREATGVLGASMGGLISLYLGLHHAETFAKVGAMSPSLWWGDRAALDHLSVMPPGQRLWLDMGHAEGERMLQDVRDLRAALEAAGYAVGRDLAQWEVPGADHSEGAWGHRAALALLYLFGAAA